MKVNFLRESEGVYLFGTRRIYIKIGKGDALMVKVGGGFMTIKQFVDRFAA